MDIQTEHSFNRHASIGDPISTKLIELGFNQITFGHRPKFIRETRSATVTIIMSAHGIVSACMENKNAVITHYRRAAFDTWRTVAKPEGCWVEVFEFISDSFAA